MTGERGFTVVELIVAAAVMLVLLAGVTGVIHDALLRVPLLEESADLQQRTRVAIETLSSEVRQAGAGEGAGPLGAVFPSVLPRHAAAPATIATASVMTLRYAPADPALGTLSAPLLPADTVLALAGGGNCPANAMACGFTAGTTAVVFDRSGNADVMPVLAAAPGALTVATGSIPRATSYAIGAEVVEIVEVTYSLDAAARVLRREQHGAAMPVADNVTQLEFRYLGVAARPTEPHPPAGVANCLYASDGTYLYPGVPAGGPLVSMTAGELVDGPFCGAGAMVYDVDLLRIRAVQVRLRLDTGVDALRGTAPVFFARPGLARDSRVIADVAASFTISLRNHGR